MASAPKSSELVPRMKDRARGSKDWTESSYQMEKKWVNPGLKSNIVHGGGGMGIRRHQK